MQTEPDDELTQPIPHETLALAQLAAQWHADMARDRGEQVSCG